MRLYNPDSISFLDEETRHTVTLDFLQQLGELVPLACAALAHGDYAIAGQHMHKLRGSCLAFGADPLADMCRTVESMANHGTREQPRQLIADLRELAARTSTALTESLPRDAR